MRRLHKWQASFGAMLIISILAACMENCPFYNNLKEEKVRERRPEMKHITTRQFSVLADCGNIYQFMLEIYERDWRNGVAAPFLNMLFLLLPIGWLSLILTKTASGRMTGRDFDRYLKKNVFEVCSMDETGYYELDRLPAKCANNYIYCDDTKDYRTNIFSVDAKGTGAGGRLSRSEILFAFGRGFRKGSLSQRHLFRICSVSRAATESTRRKGIMVMGCGS